MATRVLLTFDVELTWRHFSPGSDWRGNYALSCEPAGVGLSWQLSELARHRLDACFFVDPMPALVYGLEPVRRMVSTILGAGQEVQLHLHSFWHDLAAGRDSPRYELTAFDGDEQRRLIERARDLLTAVGAPSPIAFRSGSFAADAGTLRALAAAGLRFDSSHNGAEQPWPSALPLSPDWVDPVALECVTELPVSQIETAEGVRPLQLCALSAQEMRAALDHAAAHNHPLVTIVAHSFELASRDGRRPNRLLRRRFESLLAHLDRNRAAMPCFPVAGLPSLPAAKRSRPLPLNVARTARRLAEQA
ncbi:MAG: polysaccharide deacetylase [Sphingosinicella sp.]